MHCAVAWPALYFTVILYDNYKMSLAGEGEETSRSGNLIPSRRGYQPDLERIPTRFKEVRRCGRRRTEPV